MKQITITAVLIALLACNSAVQQKERVQAILPERIPISSGNTMTDCVYLTQDHEGIPVICWVEGDNEEAMLHYADWNENENKFSESKTVSPSKGLNPHNEMMPKMAFKPDGNMIAVWAVSNSTPESRFGGLTYYTQSFDKGKTWSNARPVTADTASNDQRYFDIETLPDGNTAIVWLDNRSENEANGSTLFYAATNETSGFQNERAIAKSTCECCRTDIFMDNQGNINVAYRDIFNDSIRDMAYSFSADNGKTFSQPQRISPDNWVLYGCPHTGPSMTWSKSGLHFFWFTAGGDEGVYHTSTNNYGEIFTERKLINSHARHPQATTLQDGTVAVVWDETFKTENTYINRIGLMLQTPDGKQETRYITPDTADAGYPVVMPLHKRQSDKLLVAWTQREGKSTRVYYSVIAVSSL